MTGISGLYTALSGLIANRTATETAGHNVANANTEGYSRQRVEMEAASAAVPAIWAKWDGQGHGVDIQAITRSRDAFLEARAHRERGLGAAADGRVGSLEVIQRSFPEPGELGIAKGLQQFWQSWDGVANQPDSRAHRQELVSRAETLARTMNRVATELEAHRDSSVTKLRLVIDEANATATRVAELNATIVKASQAGLTPNDLMDQRDLLVMKLTDMIGVTTRVGDHGSVDVFLAGSMLVQYDHAEALEVADLAAVPPGPPPARALDLAGLGEVQVRWADDDIPTVLTGGEASGLLAGLNTAIPDYLNQLNETAQALATKVNTAHAPAYDLNGGTGKAFFTPAPPATPIGYAKAIAVNAAILADPRGVQASSSDGGGGGDLNGDVAATMAAMYDDVDGPDAAYNQLLASLGVEVQSAQRSAEMQRKVVEQVDRARDAVSGVNLDEEMTQLVAFQHGYSASAQVIRTIDEMLATLINMVG